VKEKSWARGDSEDGEPSRLGFRERGRGEGEGNSKGQMKEKILVGGGSRQESDPLGCEIFLMDKQKRRKNIARSQAWSELIC